MSQAWMGSKAEVTGQWKTAENLHGAKPCGSQHLVTRRTAKCTARIAKQATTCRATSTKQTGAALLAKETTTCLSSAKQAASR